MKPIVLVLGFVLAAGAGALAGGIVAANRTGSANTAQEPLQAPAAAAVAPASGGLTPEVQARLDALAMEVASLERELSQWKLAEEQRTPVTTAASETSAPARALLSTEEFAALHRDAILKVIDDERVAQEKQREEERKVREAQQLQNRADRVAEKLSLSEGQKNQLADFYTLERQRMEDMRAQMRDGNVPGAPDNARDAFRELREWRTNELTRLFGTDLGAQINEADTERGRGALAGGRRGNNNGNNGGGAAQGGADGGAQPQGNRAPRTPRAGG